MYGKLPYGSWPYDSINLPSAAAPAVVPKGWQSVSTYNPTAVKSTPTQATSFAAPAQTASNRASQFGWYQPLSKAADVAKALPGSSSVPFNTAQVVTKPPSGWNNSLNTSVAVNKAQPTQATTFAVPPQPTPPTPTPGQFGWYQPLSKAAPVAVAKPGNAFVPLNTVQTATPATIQTVPLIQDSSDPTSVNVYYQSLFNPLRPITQVSNTTSNLAWQQPLSIAAKITTAAVQSTLIIPLPKPTPISGMAWFRQMDVVAKSIPTAPQGITFVPFDTIQVTPPPPPPSTQPDWKPFLTSMGRLSCIG